MLKDNKDGDRGKAERDKFTFITSEEILKELEARFDAVVFQGFRMLGKKDTRIHYLYSGSKYTCLGLIEGLKRTILCDIELEAEDNVDNNSD